MEKKDRLKEVPLEYLPQLIHIWRCQKKRTTHLQYLLATGLQIKRTPGSLGREKSQGLPLLDDAT